MPEDVPENCEVCGEPMDPEHNAHCVFCRRVFHLTLDMRLEIKDCGRFDVNDESLYFTCNLCLAQQLQAPSEPS